VIHTFVSTNHLVARDPRATNPLADLLHIRGRSVDEPIALPDRGLDRADDVPDHVRLAAWQRQPVCLSAAKTT
jgi:hypothetical protein